MQTSQSRANQKIKKGDLVKVISGKEKGKSGPVLKILAKQDRVIIEKLKMVTLHKKPNAQNQDGGISKKEGSIHMSNLVVISSEKSSPEGKSKKKTTKKKVG